MIAEIGNDNCRNRLTKMKKLFDIISISILQKYEDVLKRMALDTVEPDSNNQMIDNQQQQQNELRDLLNEITSIIM